MKTGHSKQKGGAFERSVCKHLSLSLTKGAKEDLFWRSAMSGGRATVMAKKGKMARNSTGDITAIAPEGHWLTDKFCIECKFYADLDILPFVLGHKRGKLWKFWQEIEKLAQKHDKHPMLVAKQNREEPFVVLPYAVVVNKENEHGPFMYLPPFADIYWLDVLFPVPEKKA